MKEVVKSNNDLRKGVMTPMRLVTTPPSTNDVTISNTTAASLALC